jgi:hypothetical protein
VFSFVMVLISLKISGLGDKLSNRGAK